MPSPLEKSLSKPSPRTEEPSEEDGDVQQKTHEIHWGRFQQGRTAPNTIPAHVEDIDITANNFMLLECPPPTHILFTRPQC